MTLTTDLETMPTRRKVDLLFILVICIDLMDKNKWNLENQSDRPTDGRTDVHGERRANKPLTTYSIDAIFVHHKTHCGILVSKPS